MPYQDNKTETVRTKGVSLPAGHSPRVQPIYSANLVKASLKVAESRIIAGLLLDNVNEAAWKSAIFEANVLQKRSPSTAKTFADYIRHRLHTMQPELWTMIRDGSPPVATQAVLAAAIKHSPLLADFFDVVLREQVRQFKTSVTEKEWADFIATCIARDPRVADWTPPVVAKLRQVVFRILHEAGYVADTKTMALQRVAIAGPVLNYLEQHDEDRVLRCVQVMA